MKRLALVCFLVCSMHAVANKPVEEIAVNFFTLAANEKRLDGRKIKITGWIKFIDAGADQSVRLFHSKSSLNLFRRDQSILILLPEQDYKAASEYLNLKFVTVYATYSAAKSMGSFGELLDVKDIDIIATDIDG
ncbi:hypothetical protein [Aliiglaciecola litoralis]|uniref:Uncharacterized protein n=1 Tax=Aliiglaciecola litoralis TaxID=582857 RepID=A0ABN1LD63_9ALTE